MSKFTYFVFLIVCSSVAFGQTEILNETFQAGIPASWTVIDASQQIPDSSVIEYTNAWIIKGDPDNESDSVVSSTSFYAPVGQANNWLITQPITLGAYGNYLKWEAKSHDPSYPENYKVLISNSNNIESFNDTVRLVVLENPEWTTREVDLSNLGFNGQTVYIAFVHTTNDGFKLYLDDISVRKEDPLTLPEMENLAISVYPNPAQEMFQISSSSPMDQVFIYSAEGKMIKNLENYSGESISTRDFKAGIYFVKVKSGNAFSTQKILVR